MTTNITDYDQDQPIETRNDFLLGAGGGVGEFGFLLHPHHMDAETAIRAAAWLVALADPLQLRFPEVLEAVLDT